MRRLLYSWVIEPYLIEVVAREIFSTNEGTRFARAFLANPENKRFVIYEPIRVFYEAGC